MTFFVIFTEFSSTTSFRTRINAVTLRYKVIWTVVYLKFDLRNGSVLNDIDSVKIREILSEFIYLFIYFNRHRRKT